MDYFYNLGICEIDKWPKRFVFIPQLFGYSHKENISIANFNLSLLLLVLDF